MSDPKDFKEELAKDVEEARESLQKYKDIHVPPEIMAQTLVDGLLQELEVSEDYAMCVLFKAAELVHRKADVVFTGTNKKPTFADVCRAHANYLDSPAGKAEQGS